MGLTQLGSDLFIGGSLYSVVIYKDDNGQVWVSHHTDKSRSYKTDWTAEDVHAALAGTKTTQERVDTARKEGINSGKYQAKHEHNSLPWYKRLQKKP